jgi:hypothetical protein
MNIGGSEYGIGTISRRYGNVLPVFGLQIYTHAKGEWISVCKGVSQHSKI